MAFTPWKTIEPKNFNAPGSSSSVPFPPFTEIGQGTTKQQLNFKFPAASGSEITADTFDSYVANAMMLYNALYANVVTRREVQDPDLRYRVGEQLLRTQVQIPLLAVNQYLAGSVSTFPDGKPVTDKALAEMVVKAYIALYKAFILLTYYAGVVPSYKAPFPITKAVTFIPPAKGPTSAQINLNALTGGLIPPPPGGGVVPPLLGEDAPPTDEDAPPTKEAGGNSALLIGALVLGVGVLLLTATGGKRR